MTTYIRCENQVFEEDDAGNRKLFQVHPSITQARRWAAQQGKKQPGSVRVEHPPQETAEEKRDREIRGLIHAQSVDQKRTRTAAPQLKEPRGLKPYVPPVRAGSSSSPGRSKTRKRSRSRNTTRASYGDS